MKNIVITGGTRGIGKALVYAFSGQGYRVFALYKNSDLEAHHIEKQYGAITYKVDITNYDEVCLIINDIIKKYKHIDVLINNAGISENSLFTDISLENWDKIISTNLSAVYNITKECIKNMVSRKYGKIINISSIWGSRGASCEAHYAASKAGVDALTRSLAVELGPSNINVNSIACGMIDTDMNSLYSKEEINDFISNLPIIRIGTPQDVSNLALFLASDEASYITGQVIYVDGGYTA